MKNQDNITEGNDIEHRTAREKGNLSFDVGLYKELNTPISCSGPDIPHPNNKDKIVKRQTTFKPIDHLATINNPNPKLKPYINMVKKDKVS